MVIYTIFRTGSGKLVYCLPPIPDRHRPFLGCVLNRQIQYLKYRLFYFDVPDETKYFEVCLYTKLANEYFIIAFLESIFRGWNNDFDGLLILDPIYKGNFIKELYRYKNDINLLDPVSFSNTLYLIEQLYFRRSARALPPE